METFKRTLTKTDVIESLERIEKGTRITGVALSVVAGLTFGLTAYAAQQVKRQYVDSFGFVFDILTVVFSVLPFLIIFYTIIRWILSERELKKQSFIVSEDRVVNRYIERYDQWHRIKGKPKYTSGLVFKHHGDFIVDTQTVKETTPGDEFYIISYSFHKKKAQLIYNKNKYNCIVGINK